MKMQALALALALIGGAALAQAPNESAKAASPAAAATPGASHVTGKHAMSKKVAMKKSHKSHAARKKNSTQSMGAGPASPMTDVDSSARQRRMDRAYADWQRRR
jgi:hypothetical protein